MGGGKPKVDKGKVWENYKREQEIQRLNVANEAKMRGMEYQNLMSKAQQDARLKAQGAVTSERAKGIKESSKLLTDYQKQERRRLFEAKKGVGQVDAGDTSITAEMVENARGLLDRGSEYWENRRTVAGDTASAKALADFKEEYGEEKGYIEQGDQYKRSKRSKALTSGKWANMGHYKNDL